MGDTKEREFQRTPRKNIDMEQVKQRYAEGASLLEIAKEVGVTHRTITERLKMHGVQIRSIQQAWNEEARQAKASAKSRAIRAAKIADETSKILDPQTQFSEIEKLILARLTDGVALVAVDICQARWPNIEADKSWFAILRLSRGGYLYQREPHRWALTGCGRLLMNPTDTGSVT